MLAGKLFGGLQQIQSGGQRLGLQDLRPLEGSLRESAQCEGFETRRSLLCRLPRRSEDH